MRIITGVPCMNMVHTDFFVSYASLRRNEETALAVSQSSLIYDARMKIAETALKLGADRILWLDSDMVFEPDLMERLNAALDAGREFVSGIYFTRYDPVTPVIYKRMEPVSDVRIDYEKYMDYPSDSVFEIAGCGFGALMMTIDLYRHVKEKYPMPFMPAWGAGEDMAFCIRARDIGAKLYCDSSIKAKHIGLREFTENDYKGE